ncbi:hypothetical protein D3C81_1836580 [compost metagenome]
MRVSSATTINEASNMTPRMTAPRSLSLPVEISGKARKQNIIRKNVLPVQRNAMAVADPTLMIKSSRPFRVATNCTRRIDATTKASGTK